MPRPLVEKERLATCVAPTKSRRSYGEPPCERERAALGLAVCGLNQKARDLRRSYKKPPRIPEPAVRTQPDRANKNHPCSIWL